MCINRRELAEYKRRKKKRVDSQSMGKLDGLKGIVNFGEKESCTQEKCIFKTHNHMMSGMLNGGKGYINLFELLIGDLVG